MAAVLELPGVWSNKKLCIEELDGVVGGVGKKGDGGGLRLLIPLILLLLLLLLSSSSSSSSSSLSSIPSLIFPKASNLFLILRSVMLGVLPINLSWFSSFCLSVKISL